MVDSGCSGLGSSCFSLLVFRLDYSIHIGSDCSIHLGSGFSTHLCSSYPIRLGSDCSNFDCFIHLGSSSACRLCLGLVDIVHLSSSGIFESLRLVCIVLFELRSCRWRCRSTFDTVRLQDTCSHHFLDSRPSSLRCAKFR